MNTESKNGLDLIKNAGKKVNGKFMKAFIGTLIMFVPLIALCFIPYAGWAISVFLFGVFETGYIRYFRRLINDENPSLKVLFSEFKTGWLETFLGACLLAMFILGGVLLLIPGLALIGLYSMSLFVAEEYKTKGVIETLKLTRQKMAGKVMEMFSYKTIFWFFYLVLFAAGFFGAWGVYALYASSPVMAIVVGIVAALVFVILYSIITVYYHSCNEAFFQELIAEDASVETPVQNVEPTEEVKVEKETKKTKTTKK